ncbi:MAG: N-acetylmuramoyl-L-alanine amidase [Phycisphaerae bacterium]|nr:N-acetylmuramoyl-L-alanine amidase [Phycisphaerae bacterium]
MTRTRARPHETKDLQTWEGPLAGLWIGSLLSLAGLAGCRSADPGLRPPQIVFEGPIAAVSPAPPPEAPPSVDRTAGLWKDVPAAWIPPTGLERRWKAVVIHHSGTDNGNAEVFDRWHRERQWDGVGYDFVIGNGTDSGDGQVEVTHRWRQQKVGAHCKTPDNWANEEAVGICVVGNFDQGAPTRLQMRALTQLIRFLVGRYAIPSSRIYGHQAVPGANETNCPGALFPLDRLIAELESALPSPRTPLGQ